MPSILNVAVFIYPGADIMDFSGPVEVYSTLPENFKITTFAHQNPVGGENRALTYVPAATVEEVNSRLHDFDILVLPGAHPDVLDKYMPGKDGKEIVDLINKFSTLEPRKETGVRILQSVCSGAWLLAAAGVLAGRKATTHHICFDGLKRLADEAAGGDSEIEVVRKRWVDGGFTKEGVRIVNAGGVSSGIDTSLWIVENVAGEKEFRYVEEIMEFERRGEGQAWGVTAA